MTGGATSPPSYYVDIFLRDSGVGDIEYQKHLHLHYPSPEQAHDQEQHALRLAEGETRAQERRLREGPRSRFINALPLYVRESFINRDLEQSRLVNWLVQGRRGICIYGRTGVGKTALACKVLADLERADDDKRPAGMVYLGAGSNSTTGISVDRILSDFSKLMSAESRSIAESVWRDTQTSLEQKFAALLAGLEGGRYVLLLDNFEVFQNSDTHQITDESLVAFLRVVLEQGGTISVLITSRYPLVLSGLQGAHMQRLPLVGGLSYSDSIALIRELDDGNTGLPPVDDEPTLKRVVEATQGFPRALEAMMGYLKGGALRTLDRLLADRQTLEDEITALIVQAAIQQLTPEARLVMEGLALMGRPVSRGVLEYLLSPYLDTRRLHVVLEQLVNAYFVGYNTATQTYSLHPADAEYCLACIPEGSVEDVPSGDLPILLERPPHRKTPSSRLPHEPAYTRYALNHRAAIFYREQRKPKPEWKTLDDLAPQLAEFEYRVRAEEFDTAADVLTDIDFDYLLLWGHFRVMAELHERLQGKIGDSELKQISVGNLGSAYYSMGQVRRAIECYEEALRLAREAKDRQGEGAWLGSLGLAYRDLGQVQKAIGYYEQALAIARAIGDRRGEGNRLGNLGNAYSALGQVQKAIDYYEQALDIDRAIGDRRGEGADLGNLGSAYYSLGQVQKAIDYYEQALDIARALGDRSGEGNRLGNLGNAYSALGQMQKAIEHYQQALAIARAIGDRRGEGSRLGSLGNAYSDLGQVQKAIGYHEQALEIAREIGDRSGERVWLGNLGIRYTELGEDERAMTHYQQALQIAREIQYPTGESINLYNIGKLLLSQGQPDAAIAPLRQSIELADGMGFVQS